MTRTLHKAWLAFIEPPRVVRPGFQWGMLIVCLLLLGVSLHLFLAWRPSYTGSRYLGLLVPTLLLINHLAWQFRWPASLTPALRLLSLGWTIFTVCYLLQFTNAFSSEFR